MRITSARFLSGPNVYDDSSGIVISTELLSLPPAGQPIGIASDRSERIFNELGLAPMAAEWAAAAVQGRAALPGFLLRLASALVTRVSIFPSGGGIVGLAPQLVAFLRCEHEATGLLAWDCACKAVLACQPGDDRRAELAAAHDGFTRMGRSTGPDPTTAAVAREARRLGVPWYRLKVPGQFVQLGQGVHRRFLFDGTSDGTGAISQLLSRDRMLTNRILGAAGVPVLPMIEVSSEGAAIKAAERIGYPVVLKPCHGGRGRGVSLHLTDRTQVATAFRLAAAGPDSAVVEKLASGHDHRTLVVDGRFVAAARRVPAGGMAIDATETVHPDNKAILERAAAAMDLAIAGIDFLTDDVTRSWREVGGVVLGLNPFPGLGPHDLAGRSVTGTLIRALLPPGSDGRIPTCAITGSAGKTTTANMVARILATAGLVVGRCTTSGMWVGGERLRAGDYAGGGIARELLLNHRVEAGVFELARGALLKGGMVIEDCDVGAVLNVFDNHIGSDGIASRADLARIKSIVSRRARRWLVLNAEDPLCLAMRQGSRAERICLVGREAGTDALRRHVDAGGAAVTVRPAVDGDEILLVDRGIARAVMKAVEIPATIAGRHGGKIWNAMFAVAIAQAMGASLDHVREGLRSFKPDIADSEGRLSIVDRHPFLVIFHPVDGREVAEELVQFVRKTPVAGRKRLFLTASGKREDDFVRTTGRTLAGSFDAYVCSNSPISMRPDPLAIPRLLQDGILAGGVPEEDVICIASYDDALRHALRESARGDLLVIVTYAYERAMALVESFDADGAGPAGASVPPPA